MCENVPFFYCLAVSFTECTSNHFIVCCFYFFPSSGSWKRVEAPQSGPSNPSTKRRRRSSPGPVIVIKDEPEDDDEVHFVRFY